MHKNRNITHGYTKHYYADSERIVSKVGGGGLSDIDADPHEDYNIQGEYGTVLAEKQKVAGTEYEMAWKCLETVNPVFGNYLMCTENDLPCPFLKNLYSMKEAIAPENDLYFYHSDHLGSASWITSTYGQAIQHLLYLPFGETMVNQRTTSWSSRYSFSAKEKDEESGYSYFGARYYDSDISIWLSVDPVASNSPHQSPYVYCSNNPIKMIDPNGMDDYEIFTNKEGKNQINVVRTDDKTNSYTYKNADGSTANLGTYDKTGDLIKLDKSTNFYEQVNYDKGKTYMNGDVAAGFLAGMFDYNQETGNKVEITQLNNASGGHSSHDGSGTNADVKYANLNGFNSKEPVWTSGSNFDKNNSQKLANSFSKFGFQILTENAAGNGAALKNTKFVDGSKATPPFHHKHHMHLQGFNKSMISVIPKR